MLRSKPSHLARLDEAECVIILNLKATIHYRVVKWLQTLGVLHSIALMFIEYSMIFFDVLSENQFLIQMFMNGITL